MSQSHRVSKIILVFFCSLIMIFTCQSVYASSSTSIQLYVPDNKKEPAKSLPASSAQTSNLSAAKTNDNSESLKTQLEVLLTGSILLGTIVLTTSEKEEKNKKREESTNESF